MNLHLLARVISEPWAIRRDHLSMVTHLLMSGEEGGKAAVPRLELGSNEIIESVLEGQTWHVDGRSQIKLPPGYFAFNSEGVFAQDSSILPKAPANVFIFLVWGILGRAWSAAERYWLDPVDADNLAESVLSTPAGSTVVLWFRSPGGISSGIEETAEVLREAGRTRRIIAFTDELCASAAYWLAAQCETITATPTASLGSIGVYIAFYDWCEYLKKAGIKLELFKAGEMKGTGIHGNPLNQAERDKFEDQVQRCYKAFTRDVTRNRRIAGEHMQGQTLSGDLAATANLLDAFSPRASVFFAGLTSAR